MIRNETVGKIAKIEIPGMVSLSLALMALLLLGNGCTCALWGTKHYHSAAGPTLKFSLHSTNIVVLYEEKCDLHPPLGTTGPIETRAYLLSATTRSGEKAEFIHLTNFDDWISIPIVNFSPVSQYELACASAILKTNCQFVVGTNVAGSVSYVTKVPPAHSYHMPLPNSGNLYIVATDKPPKTGYYAASLENEFTLWLDDKVVGTYELPNYTTHEKCTWWRVALTPVAVTGDTILVVTAAALTPPSPGAAILGAAILLTRR